MAEEDRLDPEKLVLWLDFETSGLDTKDDTVIEAGWVVTTTDLSQLTPLRSRLCAFVPGDPTGYPVTPDVGDWIEKHHEVQKMHKESGLEEEFLHVQWLRVVTSIIALDRIVLDDLFMAGWDGDSKIVLAGSGLAAFDRRILIESGSLLHKVAHYRGLDVSIAYEAAGLAVPKTEDQVFDVLTTYAPVVASGVTREDDMWLTPVDLNPLHRSAMDVAASLLLCRSLRGRIRT